MERIILVSCVKRKAATAREAQDLYESPLFRGMRRYAERHGDRWFILSALHGVVLPTERIEPYEVTLNTQPVAARQVWAAHVDARLAQLVTSPAPITVLAGERYRQFLIPLLQSRGHAIDIPMKGMRLGTQLKWLNASNTLNR